MKNAAPHPRAGAVARRGEGQGRRPRHRLDGRLCYAAQFPSEVEKLVLMDASCPAWRKWETVYNNPAIWHFRFNGPTPEALVQGRERTYFEHFWNDFAADKTRLIPEADRSAYAARLRASGTHAGGLGLLRVVHAAAKDFAQLSRTRLTMPVLTIGGEKANGDLLGRQAKRVASTVTVVVLKDTGHWILEERRARRWRRSSRSCDGAIAANPEETHGHPKREAPREIEADGRGRGVRLRRAFGFGRRPTTTRSSSSTTFRNERPRTTSPASHGIPTAASRPSPTSSRARWTTATAWATGSIGAGDIQWMTAGRGIIHQEMPKGDVDGRMHGFQLWANLPSSLKMTAPRYQDVKAGDVPVAKDDDGTEVRIVCGSYRGLRGPVDDVAARPVYLDVSIPVRWGRGRRCRSRPRARPSRTCSAARGSSATPRRRWRWRPSPRAGPTPTRGRPPTTARSCSSTAATSRGPGGRRGPPLPAHLRPAAPGARGLVRPHRHEHAGRAAARLPAARRGDLPPPRRAA